MKPAYYARCQAIYGTPQEQRDVASINWLGFEVAQFPPQSDINAAKARGENVMQTIFEPLVQSCSVLFFRALPSGEIPAGVAKEIAIAQEVGLLLLELPSLGLRRILTVDETRAYLGEIGQR